MTTKPEFVAGSIVMVLVGLSVLIGYELAHPEEPAYTPKPESFKQYEYIHNPANSCHYVGSERPLTYLSQDGSVRYLPPTFNYTCRNLDANIGIEGVQ